MKKSMFAVLVFGAMALLGSRAQAYDHHSGYDDSRYTRADCYSSDYREVVRYERPRYYYHEPVVIRRRVVVDDDCAYRPRYHHSGFRFFFGGF